MQDILSQDEIDALLHGVDGGDIPPEEEVDESNISSYDLVSNDRIVRGRMPTLEMINEQFPFSIDLMPNNLIEDLKNPYNGGYMKNPYLPFFAS